MKLFVPILAVLALSGASFGAFANVTDADMFGKPAPQSEAQRTVVINPGTKWITVQRGEVVRFVANNQEFAWDFDALSSSFDLKRIAPAGALDRKLVVYIWPNAEDLSNN